MASKRIKKPMKWRNSKSKNSAVCIVAGKHCISFKKRKWNDESFISSVRNQTIYFGNLFFKLLYYAKVGFAVLKVCFSRHVDLQPQLCQQIKANYSQSLVGFYVGIAKCQPEFTGLHFSCLVMCLYVVYCLFFNVGFSFGR